MPFQGLPEAPRRVALNRGAHAWLAELPELVAALEKRWSISVGRPFANGTEAFVAEATSLEDDSQCVLKLLIPSEASANAQHEITVLRLANGEGCARLLEHDAERGAVLLERLGPALCDLDLPVERRHEILCATAARLWRAVPPDSGLPTGAERGAWLIDSITRTWEELGRPCSERAIDHAVACARRRIAAHDDERAVLVHGDVHQWNTLRASAGAHDADDTFKLVDPDGLLADAEYDLGIIMREDPDDALRAADPRARSRFLAARTGLDETAVWEWGAVERVSTGLLSTLHGFQPSGRDMLAVAERIAAD